MITPNLSSNSLLRNKKFQIFMLLSMVSSHNISAYKDEDDVSFWLKTALAGGAIVFGAYKLNEAINERSLSNSVDRLESNKFKSDHIASSKNLYWDTDYESEDAEILNNYAYDIPGYDRFLKNLLSDRNSLSEIQDQLEGNIRSWKNSNDSVAAQLVRDSREFSKINSDRLERINNLCEYYSGRKQLLELHSELVKESKHELYPIVDQARYADRNSNYYLKSAIQTVGSNLQFPFLAIYRKLQSRAQQIANMVAGLRRASIQTSTLSKYIRQSELVIGMYNNAVALISSMYEYNQDVRAERDFIQRQQELENQRMLLEAERARLELESQRILAKERELARLKCELASINDRIVHGESYLYSQKYKIEASIRDLESKKLYVFC